MSDTQAEFLRELSALFKKYGVYICDSSGYDGEENYIGTEYHLVAPSGILIEMSDLLKLTESP